MKTLFLLSVMGVACAAASGFDPRLSVHTLVREDIFAGFMGNDLERLSRGEKNLALLLEERPKSRPEILAWQGGAALYRAVLAHEQKRSGEFQQHYQRALDLFAEAVRLSPENAGVAAVSGGSYAIFADRLPIQYRAAAWNKSYEAYHLLWQHQGPEVDRLPVHMKGEILAGLTQTAQRTGHTDEMALYLDKMLTLLANTPYEMRARRWKEDPEAAARTSVTCQSCHDPGRLAARTAALK